MLRRTADAPVPGKKQRKTENQVEILVQYRYEKCGLKVEDVMDRTKWKRIIQKYSDEPQMMEKLENKNIVFFIVNMSDTVVCLCCSRMYWTNWNDRQASIQTSYLSGFQVQNVITTEIKTPNGLTIDHLAQKLYWSDARLDKIERCNYDGSNRKVCLIFFVLWK